MEPTEVARLAKELADELVVLAVRFGTDRVPGEDSESMGEVLVMGGIQAVASMIVSLEDSRRDEEAGRLRESWNRLRLEGHTEQEIGVFNSKVDALMETILKAVYE